MFFFIKLDQFQSKIKKKKLEILKNLKKNYFLNFYDLPGERYNLEQQKNPIIKNSDTKMKILFILPNCHTFSIPKLYNT